MSTNCENIRKCERCSLYASIALGIYLLLRALTFACRPVLGSLLISTYLFSFVVWFLIWRCLYRFSPKLVTLAAICYVIGNAVRMAPIISGSPVPSPLQYMTSEQIAQAFSIVGICTFALVLWTQRIMHRFLAVLYSVFAVLIIVRFSLAESSIVTYSLVTLLRNLAGGCAYLALMVAFFVHWHTHREQLASALAQRSEESLTSSLVPEDH